MNRFLDLIQEHSHYFIPETWHKYFPLRQVLCFLGRHDYEMAEIQGRSVLLECWYCRHQKFSTRPVVIYARDRE